MNKDSAEVTEIDALLSNYRGYWTVAKGAVDEAIRWREHMNELRLKSDPKGIIDVEDNVDRLNRHLLITVVFSIMTAEAYINHYAAWKYSSSYIKKHLDSLSLKSKWIVIPELICGKRIDTDASSFEHFSQAIALRNKLVHSKTKRVNSLKGLLERGLSLDEARSAFNSIIEMSKELEKIDQEIQVHPITTTPQV